MSVITYRPATDADMPAVGKLFREAAYPDHGVDWHAPGLAPWWIVAATEDGEIVGAIQAIGSRPYGFIGEIIVRPDARGRDDDGMGVGPTTPGAIGGALYVRALQLLALNGSQLAFGVVHEDLKALTRILERHGAVVMGRYDLLYRRLA